MKIVYIVLYLFCFTVANALLSTMCDFSDGQSCCPSSPSEVIISNTVTTIPYEAFSYCINLLSVVIPNSVVQISSNAFFGCSFLSSVNLPSSVTTIEESAFAECFNLRYIKLPEGLKFIGERTFFNSGLRDIVIPKSLTTLSAYTFEYCSELRSVILPSTLNGIEEGVFSGCSRLTSIVVPNSITSFTAPTEYTSNQSYTNAKSVEHDDSDVFPFFLSSCPCYPANQLMTYSSEYSGPSPACTVSTPGICSNPYTLAISCIEEVLNLTLCLSAPSTTCSQDATCDIIAIYDSSDNHYIRDLLVHLPNTLGRNRTATIYTADKTAPYIVNNKFPLDKHGFVYHTATQSLTQIYFDRGCHVLSRRGGLAPDVLEYCTSSSIHIRSTDASTADTMPVGGGISTYTVVILTTLILLVLCVTGSFVYTLLLRYDKRRAMHEYEPRYDSNFVCTEALLGPDQGCSEGEYVTGTGTV